MKNRKVLMAAFALVALVQLSIPAKMIWDQENVLRTGMEYRFKTAPIDPNDPFRGKYIILNYEDNAITVADEQGWTVGELVYASITTDANGYAKIKSVSKDRPDNPNYIKTKVRYIYGNNSNMITVDFPFNRYYMEESKAYDAELVYRQSQRDTSQITVALISIKSGNAALKDVLIDEVPIRDLVRAN